MNKKTIVTNLRIDKNDWLQVKTVAAEQGMSANEYINYIVKNESIKKELALGKKYSTGKKSKCSIWNLPDLAKLPSKPMDASEEDKIIYGL